MPLCQLVNLTIYNVFLIQPGIQGFHWSGTTPTDGQTMHLYTGDNLTIPWKYILDPACEAIGIIYWYFHGQSEELIAVDVQARPVIEPSYSNRAQV